MAGMSVSEHKARALQSVRCFIVTVSDTRTIDTDTSGRAIADLLVAAGHVVAGRAIVTDDPDLVRGIIERQLVAAADVQAIITTGGTGITSRDRTYEAVSALLQKRLDGFGELFRGECRRAGDADHRIQHTRGDQRAEKGCGIDLARIADFFGDVRRRLEADKGVVGDDGATQDGKRRCRAIGELRDAAEVAAPAADHDRHSDDHDQQAGEFDHGHDDIALDRLADAACVEGRHQGKEHDGGGNGGDIDECGEVIPGERQRETGGARHAGRQHAEPDEKGH